MKKKVTICTPMKPKTNSSNFADGLSFDAIAEKLNVSKQTLLRRARDHDIEIRSLRAVQLDAIYDKIFASHEVEAKRLASLQSKLEAAIASRTFTIGSTFDFIKASTRVRKEIREFRKNTVDTFLAKPSKPAAQIAQERQQPAQPTAGETHSPAPPSNKPSQ